MVANDLLGGRYRLDSVLGRGGMAAVWRGVDTRLDRPVAVKVLDGAALIEPAAVERFHREAQTVARLADPHVVSVYDVGSDADRHFLVMELVTGSSLAELLTDGPLPIARAVEIAAQVCGGLGAAHAAGVVHRDVKPGNILINDRGTVKVCDFGIARLAGAAQPTLTAAGAVLGTSQYMAPEQVAGRAVDARTDLYALGCVLYAMLTGAPPFHGGEALGIAWQQLHQEPEPIATRRPEVPARLAALVDGLLAKDPEARPRSAAEVRAALSGIAADVTTAGVAAGDIPTAAVGPPAATPTAVAPLAAAPTAVGPLAATPAGAGPGARAVAAVRAPTRALPVIEDDLPPPGDRATGREARRPWAVLAAVAVAGVVIAGLVFLLPEPSGQAPQSAGGPGATTAPVVTTTPPAPPATTGPTGPRLGDRISDRITDWIAGSDRLADMRETVADAVAAGRIDEKTAKEIGKEIDDLERAIAEGDAEKIVDKTRDLGRKLNELRREGELTTADWGSLWPALGRLADGLPADDHGSGNRGGD